MVKCWLPHCKHYNERETCRFYAFPKNCQKREIWMKAVGKVGKKVTAGSRICSCHFLKGLKENGPKLSTDLEKNLTTKNPDLNCTDDRSAMIMCDNDFLQHNCEEWSYNRISHNDELVSFYTGLPNDKVFNALYKLVENLPVNYYQPYSTKMTVLNRKNQLFMCLVKLKQNFSITILVRKFGVSRDVVTNTIVTWCYVLHEILYKQLTVTVLKQEQNMQEKCVTSVILDCVKVSVDKMTYDNTCKALIGVSPNGVVTFVSGLYSATVSDKKIMKHCKILEGMEHGDLILADGGFVDVNKASFLPRRINVERAIGRMKTYKVLRLLPRNLLRHANVVLQLVGALTNLQPLIEEIIVC